MKNSSQIYKLGPHETLIVALFDIWRDSGRRSWVKVCGISMEPTIMMGAEVLIEHRPSSLAVGDMIAFKNRDHLTVHRIVSVQTPQSGHREFITKGDANSEADGPVSEELILGRVLCVRNGSGKVGQEFASPSAEIRARSMGSVVGGEAHSGRATGSGTVTGGAKSS